MEVGGVFASPTCPTSSAAARRSCAIRFCPRPCRFGWSTCEFCDFFFIALTFTIVCSYFSNYEHTLAFAEWYRGCRLPARQGETRMADMISSSQTSSAFVTVRTWLLGNDLGRLLVSRGMRV